MQLATGVWERSAAGDSSGRGFLIAYEIVGWGQRDMTTRYLAPDPDDRHYHLGELGWPMLPVDACQFIRVVQADAHWLLDDVSRRLVWRVQNGEIDFGTALTLRRSAERTLDQLARKTGRVPAADGGRTAAPSAMHADLGPPTPLRCR